MKRDAIVLLAWASCVALNAWAYMSWMLPIPPGAEPYSGTVSFQLLVFFVFFFPLWLLVLTMVLWACHKKWAKSDQKPTSILPEDEHEMPSR